MYQLNISPTRGGRGFFLLTMIVDQPINLDLDDFEKKNDS